MTLDQGIALAASIGTCVAAFLAFLALRESSRQRKVSYRPQLALKRQRIFGTHLDGLAAWSKEERQEQGAMIESALRYSVQLFNIGLGPAKGISLKWSFDKEALATKINQLAMENHSARAVDIERHGLVEITAKNGNRAAFNLNADLCEEFDFALPYHIEDRGLSVSVPGSFVTLISMLFSEAIGEAQKLKTWDIRLIKMAEAAPNETFGGTP